MKYLQDDTLSHITAFLSDCSIGDGGGRYLHGRIEAYSRKRAGTDKKYATQLGTVWTSYQEQMEEDAAALAHKLQHQHQHHNPNQQGKQQQQQHQLSEIRSEATSTSEPRKPQQPVSTKQYTDNKVNEKSWSKKKKVQHHHNVGGVQRKHSVPKRTTSGPTTTRKRSYSYGTSSDYVGLTNRKYTPITIENDDIEEEEIIVGTIDGDGTTTNDEFNNIGTTHEDSKSNVPKQRRRSNSLPSSILSSSSKNTNNNTTTATNKNKQARRSKQKQQHHRSILKHNTKFSTPKIPNAASTSILSSTTPIKPGVTTFGDLSESSMRRLLTDLILTLNMSFPDYDFGASKPTDFIKFNDLRVPMNQINERLADLSLTRRYYVSRNQSGGGGSTDPTKSNHHHHHGGASGGGSTTMGVDLEASQFSLQQLWKAIDNVIGLANCDVYSYQPNHNSNSNNNNNKKSRSNTNVDNMIPSSYFHYSSSEDDPLSFLEQSLIPPPQSSVSSSTDVIIQPMLTSTINTSHENVSSEVTVDGATNATPVNAETTGTRNDIVHLISNSVPTAVNTTTVTAPRTSLETVLWSFNYFFVNKTTKRIVLFTCIETMKLFNDDDYDMDDDDTDLADRVGESKHATEHERNNEDVMDDDERIIIKAMMDHNKKKRTPAASVPARSTQQEPITILESKEAEYYLKNASSHPQYYSDSDDDTTGDNSDNGDDDDKNGDYDDDDDEIIQYGRRDSDSVGSSVAGSDDYDMDPESIVSGGISIPASF